MPCGTFISSTMMVIMMAITPSVNASSRPFPICPEAHRAARQAAAAPQAAITASASEISTSYPASDRPRKRHAASSQRTIELLVREDNTSLSADDSVSAPEHSCGHDHYHHS